MTTKREMMAAIFMLDTDEIANKKLRAEIDAMQDASPKDLTEEQVVKLFTKLQVAGIIEKPEPAKKETAAVENATVKKTASKTATKKAPEPEPEEKPAKKAAKPAKKEETFEFPETVEVNDQVYKLVEEISIEELGDDHVVASFWPKKEMRYYDTIGLVAKEDKPKSFDNDLDLSAIVYVAENGLYVSCVSLYTENNSVFLAGDFDDFDSNGLPFRIYVKQEEKPVRKAAKKPVKK